MDQEEIKNKNNKMEKKHHHLHKSLHHYLSKKLKNIHSSNNATPKPNKTSSSSSHWLLSACKYPKTPSFAAGRNNATSPTPLADSFRFLHVTSTPDEELDATSSSVLDGTRPSASSTSSLAAMSSVPGGSTAVVVFSMDVYEDFRRSMQEMVEARGACCRNVEEGLPRRQMRPLQVDWDFMEELLFCYLELNDRSVHKHILRAFTDVVVAGEQRSSNAVGAALAKRRRRRKRKGRDGKEKELLDQKDDEVDSTRTPQLWIS